MPQRSPASMWQTNTSTSEFQFKWKEGRGGDEISWHWRYPKDHHSFWSGNNILIGVCGPHSIDDYLRCQSGEARVVVSHQSFHNIADQTFSTPNQEDTQRDNGYRSMIDWLIDWLIRNWDNNFKRRGERIRYKQNQFSSNPPDKRFRTNMWRRRGRWRRGMRGRGRRRWCEILDI
jgi:hypothetical protein